MKKNKITFYQTMPDIIGDEKHVVHVPSVSTKIDLIRTLEEGLNYCYKEESTCNNWDELLDFTRELEDIDISKKEVHIIHTSLKELPDAILSVYLSCVLIIVDHWTNLWKDEIFQVFFYFDVREKDRLFPLFITEAEKLHNLDVLKFLIRDQGGL